MLSLPTDVQIIILEGIRSKDDLKALCLTCKELRAITTPLLYRTIRIRTWRLDETDRFLKSVEAGAVNNLQNTRSLTFEDERYVADPRSLEKDWSKGNDQDIWRNCDHNSRDDDMSIVLAWFPDNRLHTFRFIAYRYLNWEHASYLHRCQRYLRHLCAEWKPDSNGPLDADLKTVDNLHSFPLHTLDIQLSGSTDMSTLLESITLMPNLKRLSLSWTIRGTLAALERSMRYVCDSKLGLESEQLGLETLSLRGMDLRELGDHLFKYVDFSSLLNLTLDGCNNATEFAKKLGALLKSTSSALRHFQLVITDCAVEFNDSLEDLLECSKDITSFHYAGLCEHTIMQARISRIGSRLKSFGCHDFPGSDWTNIFPHLPNVEELGIQLDTSDLDPEEWARATTTGGGSTFEQLCLTHFKHMPNLHTVHFRSIRTRHSISQKFQRFANAFFQYMDTHVMCPKLNALVLGSFWGINFCAHMLDYYAQIPRYFFIKQYQTDDLGRKTAIAVPVPAHILREVQPVSGILDLDPERSRIGRTVSRLREIR